MNWPLAIAAFFVLWWVVLFAVLPIGLRTQDDENDVTFGTVPSAPTKARHVAKSMLLTTLLSLAIAFACYVASTRYGLSLDSLPQIVPDFD